MRHFTFLPFVIAVLCTSSFSLAQVPSFDLTFGGTGLVTTTFGTGADFGATVGRQGDGKIVVSGYTHVGATDVVAVARFHDNGTLDSGFSGDGKATISIVGGNDYGFGMGLFPDGDIVIGGTAWNGSNQDFSAYRFNSDGSPDIDFSLDGKVNTGFGAGHDRGYALCVDGTQVLVAGTSHNGVNDDAALLRYNADGSLDNTFGSGGKVTTAIGGASDGNQDIRAIALQPDGRILIAGSSFNGSNNDVALIRYNSNGALDDTFGNNGVVITSVGPGDESAASILLVGNQILVAGIANNKMLILRFDNDGGLDTGFGTNGHVIVDVGTQSGFSAMALCADGDVILAGRVDMDLALVRIDPSGTLDSDFGIDGVFTHSIGSGLDNGRSLAMMPDGRILVTGFTTTSSNIDLFVARFIIDASSTSLDSNDGPVDVQVFPNPTSGSFIIRIPEHAGLFRADITDLTGRIVQMVHSTNQECVQVELEHPVGEYLLDLFVGNQRRTVKLLKRDY